MVTILIAGAGRSSIYLIEYLLNFAPRNHWKIIIADSNEKAITEKAAGSQHVEAAVIDITKTAEREPLVKRADIVLSLMPPHLHIHLAKDCLKHKKNLITSSYISAEMKEMDKAVKEAGLMFMCEMGLDPGIDHMSASKIIHGIQRVAGVITGFSSYCGGLIAPESDNNPWHYKFTWNPQNVIAAGADGAKYLHHGKQVDVPYNKIFEHNKKINAGDLGQLAYYPNRDSIKYLKLYDLPDAKTFMRATLRHPLFCKGWQALVLLGLTDGNDVVETKGATYASWLMKRSGHSGKTALPEFIAQKLKVPENDQVVIPMLQWLGLFDEKPLPHGNTSSAGILFALLKDKWQMAPDDKDMVVMQHEVEYIHRNDIKTKLTSSMVVKGENSERTAMAKTVGLPIGILTRMVLNKKIKIPSGVLIPNMVSVYRPVLTELAHHGIIFKDEVE